jgi:hypothetical protein
MRLKIAGGPHDGQWRDMDVDRDYIELVKARRRKPNITMHMAYGEGPGVLVEKTGYTVRRLRYKHPDGSIEDFCFLAPVSMTDLEAIKHQFRK